MGRHFDFFRPIPIRHGGHRLPSFRLGTVCPATFPYDHHLLEHRVLVCHLEVPELTTVPCAPSSRAFFSRGYRVQFSSSGMIFKRVPEVIALVFEFRPLNVLVCPSGLQPQGARPDNIMEGTRRCSQKNPCTILSLVGGTFTLV